MVQGACHLGLRLYATAQTVLCDALSLVALSHMQVMLHDVALGALLWQSLTLVRETPSTLTLESAPHTTR